MDMDKKNMDELGIVDVFNYITLLEKDDYCNADGKDISLFIGATRCGKSTTMNLFLGNTLKIKMDDDSTVPKINRKILLVDEKDNDGKFPVIGTKTVSETTVPIKYAMQNGEILWDCPGFGDSRGAQQEIVNAWFINRLFETAKGVKLFNLVSSEALTQSNVPEFRGYIQQLQDLFGLENISSLNQTLIFTKADRNDSVDDLKESLMYLLNLHFPKSEMHNFFDKAEAIKIEKPQKSDIGKTITINDIPGLADACNMMRYQKMKPHVAVDAGAKLFLHQSVSELSRVASNNMKNAYMNAYHREMKSQIEKIFVNYCSEKDFMKLSSQFVNAKQDTFNKVSSDSAINKEEELLSKISDFVLKIIPENTTLKNIVEANIKAVKFYNTVVLDYIVTVKFLKFLKDHSKNITDKDEFHKGWDNQIARLEKPKFSDLSQNLEMLYQKSLEANKKIMKLHEEGKLEAEKKVMDQFKEELAAAQKAFNDKMHEYEQKMEEASKLRALVAIPIIGVFFLPKYFHACQDAVRPTFKELDAPKVSTILDKSFSHYLAENPLSLLGDIVHDYWK